MTQPDPGVRFAVEGDIARVTLSRPERRNSQTPSTWLAVAEFAASLDPAVRVVVVGGEGPSFSAGLDRRLVDGTGIDGEPAFRDWVGDDDRARSTIASYQRAFDWLHRSDIVTVAAVQGHAVGAGFQLALACDIRVLADDAQLTMAEPSLGLVPDLGGTRRLVELVGYARALEICATTRRVGATEAERIGLANVVVPVAELTAATDDLVAAVLATNRDAVRATKALLLDAARRDLPAQLRQEREAQVRRLQALLG